MQKGILITGGTGFLGLHILKELVDSTDKKLYCLIRGECKNSARKRLEQLLELSFELDKDRILSRVEILNGDFTKDYLGLEKEEYYRIGSLVSKVVHTGAIVKHLGKKKDYETTNIKGTENIVMFCKEFGSYLLYTSSVAVINYNDKSEKHWSYQNEDEVDFYVKSKILAEKLVQAHMENGLHASILRIGALFGRYSDGVFQNNISDNAVCARIKTMILTGQFPKRFLYSNVELLPVDSCSEVIVRILLIEKTGILCLYNDNTITNKELIAMLSKLGYSVQVYDYQDFLSYYKNVKHHPIKNELFTGFYFHYKRRRNNQVQNNKYYCELTKEYLEKNNWKWPMITLDYLDKLINHMKTREYLTELDVDCK